MPWTAQIDTSHHIVELTYSGIVTPSELKDALVAAAALSKQHNANLFLADCTRLVGGHSVSDLYLLISTYEAAGLHPGQKEALVLPSSQPSKEDVKFYEDACLNRGYLAKIFTNVEDARAWLHKWETSV
jgi:hypothetical protein